MRGSNLRKFKVEYTIEDQPEVHTSIIRAQDERTARVLVLAGYQKQHGFTRMAVVSCKQES